MLAGVGLEEESIEHSAAYGRGGPDLSKARELGATGEQQAAGPSRQPAPASEGLGERGRVQTPDVQLAALSPMSPSWLANGVMESSQSACPELLLSSATTKPFRKMEILTPECLRGGAPRDARKPLSESGAPRVSAASVGPILDRTPPVHDTKGLRFWTPEQHEKFLKHDAQATLDKFVKKSSRAMARWQPIVKGGTAKTVVAEGAAREPG